MKRYLLTILLFGLLTTTGFAQSPIQVDAKQAIKLTEEYIKKNNIDVTTKFISRVTMHPADKTNLQPYWTISYISGFKWRGGAVLFTISADSKITHQYQK